MIRWLKQWYLWLRPAPVVRRPINVVDPELVAKIEARAEQLRTASNVLPLHGEEWRKRQRRRAAAELWGGPAA